MDFGCTMNTCKEGTGCKIVKPQNSRLCFSKRYLSAGNFRNPSSLRTLYTQRKVRKALISYGCYSPGVVFSMENGTNLISYSSLAFRTSRKLRLQCQGNDSLPYVDGNGRNIEFIDSSESSKLYPGDGYDADGSGGRETKERDVEETPGLEELKDLLQKALKELEVARINSKMFEDKAQRISETAITLKDEADDAWSHVNETLEIIQEVVKEETAAKEAVQTAIEALSLAEARLQVARESLRIARGEKNTFVWSEELDEDSGAREGQDALLVAEEDIRDCQTNLSNCEAELRSLQGKKEGLQTELNRLNEFGEKARLNALKAEENVADIMLLAEQAVAFELEAAKRVSDAEIALQRAERSVSGIPADSLEKGKILEDKMLEEKMSKEGFSSIEGINDSGDISAGQPFVDHLSDKFNHVYEEHTELDESDGQETKVLDFDSARDAEVEAEKLKNVVQTKKPETQKDLNKENPFSAPKALINKSSRFFSASFFSFTVNGTEFTAGSVFQNFIEDLNKPWPKLVLGLLLLGAG
ncbi:hypothetical protein SAY86_012770 [Trapa natans]|uniref:Uncharacterized protein n=1 Tax=Trapa natans TaxID=22666 RepID=A0AAN7RBW3_TRANT|nr:hypothetical protein SAY86_012770 [Trapa natans]